MAGQNMRSLKPLSHGTGSLKKPSIELHRIFENSRVIDVETSNCAMNVLVLTDDGLYNPANITIAETNM